MLDRMYWTKNGYQIFETNDLKKDSDYKKAYTVYYKKASPEQIKNSEKRQQEKTKKNNTTYKKAERLPLLLVYSYVTRAYGVHFDDENSMIPYFLNEGIDVYILDWGNPDTPLSCQNGWSIPNYVDKIDNIVEALKADYSTKQINLFSICAGTVFTFQYLASHAHKISKVLLNDAIIFGTRDMGSEKTGEIIKLGMEMTETFFPWMVPFIRKSEFPMGLINLFFVLPSTAPSMLLFSNLRTIKESGLPQFIKMLQWAMDDRFVAFSIWEEMMKAFGVLTDEEVESQLKEVLNKNKNLRFYNLIGDDDIIVKPSCSTIAYDDDKEVYANNNFDRQEIVNGGHFMYARKCNKMVEKIIQDAAEWLRI